MHESCVTGQSERPANERPAPDMCACAHVERFHPQPSRVVDDEECVTNKGKRAKGTELTRAGALSTEVAEELTGFREVVGALVGIVCHKQVAAIGHTQSTLGRRIELLAGYGSSTQTIRGFSPIGRVGGWVIGANFRAPVRNRLGWFAEVSVAQRGFSVEPSTPIFPPIGRDLEFRESWLDIAAGLSLDLMRSKSTLTFDAGLARSGSDGAGTVRDVQSGNHFGDYTHGPAATSGVAGLRYTPSFSRGVAVELRHVHGLSNQTPNSLFPDPERQRSSRSQQLRIVVPLWRSR